MKVIPIIDAMYSDIADIYQHGLDSGIATFETQVPSWKVWDEKFLPYARLAAEIDGRIGGWAALIPISKRKVYEKVNELSIYISPNFRGKGVGRLLLNQLIAASEIQGVYSLQAVIFSKNTSSVKLHSACGFRVIRFREKVAQRDGRWHDNILMERRSEIISI
ncbi:MAG: L-amino acid N-acyltransferase YncA [Spirosomataceae bacterium]|jgi:L-amino acid N-acyltransferase YncA